MLWNVMRFLFSVKKHSINVHSYKFINTTNLQLKQKQELKRKLTQVLPKNGERMTMSPCQEESLNMLYYIINSIKKLLVYTRYKS